MAAIIRLDQFNVGCRHHANGIRFPHAYRATGFEYDLVDEGLVPRSTVAVEPFYTLSEIGDHGIANATILPIKSLNPELNKGWLIVRHHPNEHSAQAYIDCISDYHPLPYHQSGQMVWQTSDGIFTLIHRPARYNVTANDLKDVHGPAGNGGPFALTKKERGRQLWERRP